jgi:hypothetical protein
MGCIILFKRWICRDSRIHNKNPFSVKKKHDTMNKLFIKHLVHGLYNTFQKMDMQRFNNI